METRKHIAAEKKGCGSHNCALSEITGGQITTNEVLGNIFQHFCVGK